MANPDDPVVAPLLDAAHGNALRTNTKEDPLVYNPTAHGGQLGATTGVRMHMHTHMHVHVHVLPDNDELDCELNAS
jgi:hypothetical protein